MSLIIYYYLKHTRHWLVVGMLAILGSTEALAQLPTDSAFNQPDSIIGTIIPTVPSIDTEALQRQFAAMPHPRRNVNIYDLPYSTTANYPDYKRLAINTGALYVAGIAALGVLQALPEDATAWNKDRITSIPFWKRWSTHVKHGPVWDGDSFIFNYILHPYGGATYYMSARSSGCNIMWSALYATFVSTVFWEYGIEAFMEIPSLQDLIITPFAGTIIGEGFYVLKRHIVSQGYSLFGSQLLGNIVAYIIDPVNEVIGLFAGNPCRKATVRLQPNISSISQGLTLAITF